MGFVLILVPASRGVDIVGIRWIGGSVTSGIMTSFLSICPYNSVIFSLA